MTDPIVEEVRKYRNEHARRFNYDLDAICKDLMKQQALHKNRLVNLKRGKRLSSNERKKRVVNASTLAKRNLNSIEEL